MRLAVVSDIHGNLPALEAVIAEMAAARVDLVVDLGDLLSGPLWPAETCDRLMALDWPTIRGNHERQLLADPAGQGWSDAQTTPLLAERHRRWLAGLPTTRRLAGGAVMCVHGTPSSDLQYMLETVTPDRAAATCSPGVRAASADEVRRRCGAMPAGVELLLCGHSHVPRLVADGTLLIVNPGSVGLQAFDDEHPHPHVVETASPLARWALVERGPAGWQAALHGTRYDHEAAARRAESRGRGDWADALRHGRVGRTEDQARQSGAGLGDTPTP
jgi:predicted phosphodiesterase